MDLQHIKLFTAEETNVLKAAERQVFYLEHPDAARYKPAPLVEYRTKAAPAIDGRKAVIIALVGVIVVIAIILAFTVLAQSVAIGRMAAEPVRPAAGNPMLIWQTVFTWIGMVVCILLTFGIGGVMSSRDY